ncbi:glucose-1-phosphate adenylyltransferase 1 [Methyloglobulus morosus KoM1]|uniref:Glucose-1-phosphate adenylyltransferase 1 n=1 Tax=Methyloglobulus morosus KoM1 TaxID=1116472 RepID=V5BPG4_9GAMM|nr:glucose-1-phosphate adenylyltransferase 1 [Methyloglobulus morosus KoM1]
MPELHISHLTRNTIALILAGGRGARLMDMTDWRAKPAVPFVGKFRIIDFPLSNCINSGIRKIGILTQYKAHSLIRHIQQGWGFLRGEFGEYIELFPAQQRHDEDSWYKGTADAVIGRHCRITKAIIEKGCEVPEGTVIGENKVEDEKS